MISFQHKIIPFIKFDGYHLILRLTQLHCILSTYIYTYKCIPFITLFDHFAVIPA